LLNIDAEKSFSIEATTSARQDESGCDAMERREER